MDAHEAEIRRIDNQTQLLLQTPDAIVAAHQKRAYWDEDVLQTRANIDFGRIGITTSDRLKGWHR